jgi:hypothetical protein
MFEAQLLGLVKRHPHPAALARKVRDRSLFAALKHTSGYGADLFLLAASCFSVAVRSRERQSSSGRLLRIRPDYGGRGLQPGGSSP